MTDVPRLGAVLGRNLARLHDGPVFGLAGSGNFELLAAFAGAGGRYVGTRHEAGAVMMADGWAQRSGRPGVASVHQGPGFTNALTAVVDSIKGRVPMLVLAADSPAGSRSGNQFIDQAALLQAAGIGADVVVLDDAATAVAGLGTAYARARDERCCIVVMLPVDVLAAPARDAASADPAAPAEPIPLSDADRDRIVEVLSTSRTPAILAGRGAVDADAAAAIASVAVRLGAPLLTTAPARGLFAGDPLAAGLAGGFGTRLSTDLLQEADVLLAFGTTLSTWTLLGGAALSPDVHVIRIDTAGDRRDGMLEVRADARLAAEALAADERLAGAGRRAAELDALVSRIAAGAAPTTTGPAAVAGLDPNALLARLDELLPVPRTVAIDSGHFMAFAAVHLGVTRGGDLLFGQAFQSVGLGLARATGAALARPGEVTVAVVGDGGFFMGAADLETAVRVGARLVVVVVNDEGFGAEVHDFEPLGIDAGIARYPGTDAASLARGAGAQAHVIRSLADLDAIARELRSPDGPVVLDCRVDPAVDAADILTEEGRVEWSMPMHA